MIMWQTQNLWNTIPGSFPHRSTLNGQRGFYTVPGEWFVRVVSQRYEASPNEDFDAQVYTCWTNEVGQLVFQDLYRDLLGPYEQLPHPSIFTSATPFTYLVLRDAVTLGRVTMTVANGQTVIEATPSAPSPVLDSFTLLDRITGNPARITIRDGQITLVQAYGASLTFGSLKFLDSVNGATARISVEDSQIITKE